MIVTTLTVIAFIAYLMYYPDYMAWIGRKQAWQDRKHKRWMRGMEIKREKIKFRLVEDE